MRQAVSIILLADGKVLLNLRDNIPGIDCPGQWACLGGGIEPGETPDEAAIRELAEELAASGGQPVQYSPLKFLCLEERVYQNKPLLEHVFYTRVLTDVSYLQITEGQRLAAFTFDECAALDGIALHNQRNLARFRQALEGEVCLAT
jgi:8-oxo-dGTP diphosphatase